MGALADLNDLVNRATGGNSGTPEHIWFGKVPRIAGGAEFTTAVSAEYSLWMWDGVPGAPAATPGSTAVAPDNTTAGALKQADPGVSRQKWLHHFTNFCNFQNATFLLYDRLLHVSGLSGTVTTAQTVGGAITRYTGAESWGNQAWVEIYTAVGATPRTISANYTDENGSAQVSVAAAIGPSNANDLIRLPLTSGGQGVRGVTDVTLSGSTGTAGDFGVTIARPLAYLNVQSAGGGAVALTYLEQLAEVKAGACLALAMYAHAAQLVPWMGFQISMVEA